jgi:hypothetical protein
MRRFDRATMTDVAGLRDAIDDLSARVDALTRAHEHEMKWRAALQRDLRAVLRHQFLPLAGPLTSEFGWTGLMVDASAKAVARARATFCTNPAVTVVHARVTPGNVNELLPCHGGAGDIDFLSIDVDGHDYWLLQALAAASPRVLAVEYNALFGPTRAVTVPETPIPAGAPKAYHGASLAALERLARSKGYRLVVCEDTGVNAFFLRDGVAPHLEGVTPAVAFRPMRNRKATADEAPIKALDLGELCERQGLPLVEV